MDIKKLLADWGFNAVALVAGTIGSVVKLTLDDKEISFRSAIAQVSASMAFSGYGTEWLAKWFHLEANPSACGFLGLCLGICGLYVAKGVTKWGKKFEKDPESFIKTKGGLKDDISDN